MLRACSPRSVSPVSTSLRWKKSVSASSRRLASSSRSVAVPRTSASGASATTTRRPSRRPNDQRKPRSVTVMPIVRPSRKANSPVTVGICMALAARCSNAASCSLRGRPARSGCSTEGWGSRAARRCGHWVSMGRGSGLKWSCGIAGGDRPCCAQASAIKTSRRPPAVGPGSPRSRATARACRCTWASRWGSRPRPGGLARAARTTARRRAAASATMPASSRSMRPRANARRGSAGIGDLPRQSQRAKGERRRTHDPRVQRVKLGRVYIDVRALLDAER